VKGLIFNLLDSMARRSGCADEAWDLVMEFVASEREPTDESDTCLSCFDSIDDSLIAFETPAEAMVQCLGREGRLGETLSEFPEFSATFEGEEWADEALRALREQDGAYVGNEGFSQDLLGLLEQLLAEALAGEDDDDDEAEELRMLGSGDEPGFES